MYSIATHGIPISPTQGMSDFHFPKHDVLPVVQLNLKETVEKELVDLHKKFTKLVSKIICKLVELVNCGTKSSNNIATYIEVYLNIQGLKKLTGVDEIFDFLRQHNHFDFINCSIIESLVEEYFPTEAELKTQIDEYINKLDAFLELSQVKHVVAAIKQKLALHSNSFAHSDQTTPVVIGLNGRWENVTVANLRKVVEYYFGPETSKFSHIHFDRGTSSITLEVPNTCLASFRSQVAPQTDSMTRIGISELFIHGDELIKSRHIVSFDDYSFRLAYTTGKTFEVSILQQLGVNSTYTEIKYSKGGFSSGSRTSGSDGKGDLGQEKAPSPYCESSQDYIRDRYEKVTVLKASQTNTFQKIVQISPSSSDSDENEFEIIDQKNIFHTPNSQESVVATSEGYISINEIVYPYTVRLESDEKSRLMKKIADKIAKLPSRQLPSIEEIRDIVKNKIEDLEYEKVSEQNCV